MSHKEFTHDPAACPLCELFPPDAYRRHWKHEPKAGAWHILADGPDLTRRLPRQAHFLTVLSYRIGDDGGPAIYRGSFYFEFDAPDPSHALNDLRHCMSMLEAEYNCPLEAIHTWHSGKRGFHATIPPAVIGAEFGHPLLPRIYAAMVERLFPPRVAPTLDRTVYSGGKGRMWRLPNRRRADSGRFKVPLHIREVLHHPYTDLEGLTLRPRKGFFWPSDDELSPYHGLVALYQQTVAALGAIQPTAPSAASVAGRILAGQRNSVLASLAGSMRHRGASEEAIAAALMVENRQRCDPPLPDEEIRRIAASIARYRPAVPVAARSRMRRGRMTSLGAIRTIAAKELMTWRR